MKYNYISLKNGVLFRTQQGYTWVSNVRGGEAIVPQSGDTLDGDIKLPASSWTAIKDFDCCWDDVQATWVEA